MAGEEERIYISYYKNNPCENCGKDYCAEGSCFCDIEFARSIQVTKAIEVMAEAICWEREHYPFEELPQYAIDFYIKQAKSALNALLKGVKR